ncbi:MAG: hypothetical protein J6U20_03140 [Fibrobacter sp.]|nr:hypothetical protein [Fibrobacter sp.]
MKLAYVALLATSLAFWACSDDESSSTKPANETPSSSSEKDTKDNGSQSESYDCTTEDGVVVVYPKGGETFKLGETIKVVYGADPSLAGPQFVFKYRENEEDMGTELIEESAGEKNPDGKTCYEQEVKLDGDLINPSSEAFIQVVPYSKTKKNGKSGKFTVTE